MYVLACGGAAMVRTVVLVERARPRDGIAAFSTFMLSASSSLSSGGRAASDGQLERKRG
jgi:hypothetical protein